MGKGGKASEPSTPQANEGTSEEVPYFSEFIQDGFSANAFASKAIEQSTQAAQVHIAQLEQSIRLLKEKLAVEVVKRQDEFLEQASSMRSAEEAIQGISVSAETLAVSLKRVSDEIMDPYRAIQLKTLQLKNLQASTDVLRHILQSIKVTQRIKILFKTENGGTDSLSVLDLGKAAKLLTEVKAINEAPYLGKIAIIQAEINFLENAKSTVLKQAQDHLNKGMESTSQAEVGGALQIFFNLDQLPQAVHGLIDSQIVKLEKQLNAALDPKKLAGEVSTHSSSANRSNASTRVQEILWQRLEEFMTHLHKSAIAIWHLQRVLVKKRDPLTHVLFMDTFLSDNESSPLKIFWPRVSRVLKNALDLAISPSKGAVMRETLVHNFSHLASLIENFFKKLHQETNVRGAEPAFDDKTEESVLEALNGCQNLYLGAVFGRISDAIISAFPGGSRALPTSAELQKCIARMHEELKNVGDSPKLASVTTLVIGKALRMLAEKAEFMALAGSEVRNVTGVCTTQQMRKIMLCNHLQEVSKSVSAFFPRLPPTAAHNLRAPIEILEAGALEAIMPLIRAILDRGESILLKLHDEIYQSESTSISRSSNYVIEFSRHLSHCRIEFISKLSPPANPQHSNSLGSALVQRLASRFMIFYIRHLSLVRSSPQAMKLQLAKDISDFEEAISSNLYPTEKLPQPQKLVRAFRKLLFLETDSIKENPVLNDLPASVIIQHLVSRLPENIQMPHLKAGLTPQQFSLWQDEHTSKETISFVQSNLSTQNLDNESEFEPILSMIRAFDN